MAPIRNLHTVKVYSRFCGSLVGLALLVAAQWPVDGQELVLPSDVPRSLDAAGRLLTKEAPPGGLSKLGPFDLHPHVSGSVYHDDNINGTATNQLADVVWTIAPGLSAIATDLIAYPGRTFTLEYTPVFRFYTEEDRLNSVDHAGRIAGLWPFARMTLGFGQTFSKSSQASVDVGNRVDSFSSSTALTSKYQLGYKTSVDVNARFLLEDNDQFFGSRTWSNDDWLNYQVGTKLTLGAGLVFGYVDVDDDPAQTLGRSTDQLFGQVRVRAAYFVNRKVNLNASLGGEWRHYHGGADDTLSPVWDLNVVYSPRAGTTLSASVYQRYSSSALTVTQNYLSTGLDASIVQRLGKRFGFHLGGGYFHADYESTVASTIPVPAANRSDDSYHVRGGVDVYLSSHWTAGLFYSYDRVDSTSGLFSHARNQFGLQSSWNY